MSDGEKSVLCGGLYIKAQYVNRADALAASTPERRAACEHYWSLSVYHWSDPSQHEGWCVYCGEDYQEHRSREL